jgi:competence protein ComEC
MEEPSQKISKSPFQGFLPFFWLALAFTIGILLADWIAISPWYWFGGVVVCVLVFSLGLALPKSMAITHQLRHWAQMDHRLPGVILAVTFFLGAWRYAATRPIITPNNAAYYNDRGKVQVIGEVVQFPEIRDRSINLVVEVQSMSLQGNGTQKIESPKVRGLILVQTQPNGDWAYGDVLRITGELQTPYETADFSYRDYLARQGILSLMPYAHVERVKSGQGSVIKAFLYHCRIRGYEILQKLFPPPESDLLSGILLGRDEGLSEALQEAFRRTGTTHIIAISGFNIAILAGLFSSLFNRLLGWKWGALAAILAIAGYTLLVGADPAVVRAAIMGGVGVFGGMFGRRQNGLNSIGLAGLLMTLVNPNIPWDVGFQLSVAATMGLVLYAQPMEGRLINALERWMSEEQANQWGGLLSEFFLFTLAAQVMTLPLILYHFGEVSWLVAIANPLILPPQSLVMILGGLAMLAGMILPGLGQILAILALPFVRYTIRMVSWISRWPGGDVTIPSFNPLWLIVFYAVLFLLTLFPAEQRKRISQKALSPASGILILAGLTVFIWTRVLSKPDGRLHMTLLDSEGTVLIQAPHGGVVLIGGGPSPSYLKQALGSFLPSGDRTLDAVIVASTARDNLNGLLGALTLYDAEMALWGVDPEANQTTSSVYALLLEEETYIQPLTSGQTLDLGGGSQLEVYWIGEKGAVFWLEWGNFSALIPTGKVEDHWLKVSGAPDLLIMPKDLALEEIPLWQVNRWSPSVVFLPLGESDLPLWGEHEWLTLFEGYPLVSSYEYGWVHINTDGEHLWVNTER